MITPLTFKYRAVAYGPDTLTDAELLALLTRIDPMILRETIEEHGLHEVFSRRYDLELADPQRVKLEAIYLIAQRISKARYVPGLEIRGPEVIGTLLVDLMQYSEVEMVKLVLLDTRGKMLRIHDLALGTSNASIIMPKDVAMVCLRAGCSNVILAHNHPSSNTEFSDSDIDATRKLSEGLQLVGIRLVDHFVIGAGEYRSMKRLGIF